MYTLCDFVSNGLTFPFVFFILPFLAAGLSGALQNNTFGSGKFNYTYTPSSTTANTIANTIATTTAITPAAADSVSSGNNGSGVTSATGGANANSVIPRSPRALNSTSKKLSFTTGSSKNSATVGASGTGAGSTGGGDLVISPRAAGVQVSAGLKRTNSSHQHVR